MIESTYGFVYGIYLMSRLNKGLFPANMDSKYVEFNDKAFDGIYVIMTEKNQMASIDTMPSNTTEGLMVGKFIDTILESSYLIDLPDIYLLERVLKDAVSYKTFGEYGWTEDIWRSNCYKLKVLSQHLRYYENLKDKLKTDKLCTLINRDYKFKPSLMRFELSLLALLLECNEIYIRTRNKACFDEFIPEDFFDLASKVWSEEDLMLTFYNFCKNLFINERFYMFLQNPGVLGEKAQRRLRKIN